MCARRRTYLLLLRQKKVGQEKTTPLPVSLRFATGSLRCSVRRGWIPTRAIASLGPIAPRCASASAARSASPTPGVAAKAAAVPDPAPHPFWLRREAQGLGWVRVPQDTRTSLSSSSRMFERSSKNEASSATPPQDRASQVARSEAKGRRQRGAVSLPTFFLRKKKVGAPPGAHPGSRTPTRHAVTITPATAQQAQEIKPC